MRWFRHLAGALGNLSLRCQQATRLQSEAMDRRLSFFQKLGLRLHLFLCKWCRRYGEQLKFLRSAARESEEHESRQEPERLSPEARQRIKQRLESSQE
jgi:hypothetical protein